MRAALIGLVLLAGCNDDRKRVAMDVFVCNPSSHTADSDCGDGYLCYSAAQAVGSSVCVPACDPNDPTSCPHGRCTLGGECLTSCVVGDDAGCSAGGGILSCVRTDYSPSLPPGTENGVCLPVAFPCSDKVSCDSPVFNLCTNETNGPSDGPGLALDGAVCAQGHCVRDGVACEPGSSCIQEVLPPAIADNAPDVCTPNCLTRTRPDGTKVDECVVGFTCLTQTFPEQTGARVCVPGYAGWLCTDPLGCGAGSCLPWSKDSPFDQLLACAPPCAADADCVPYQAGPAARSNPNAYSSFTCHEGRCRSFQSLFFSTTCLRPGAICQLDKEATCGANPLGGVSPPPGFCPTLSMGSVTATSPSVCQRSCASDDDCAQLSAGAHVKYSCVSGLGRCFPSVPYLTPCSGDASCMAGLSCLAPNAPDAPPYPICTLACQSSAECANHPSLGSTFVCAFGQCTPRVESGCPPRSPTSDDCLSGVLKGGLCVSPTHWWCDSDSRCASGSCVDHHCT